MDTTSGPPIPPRPGLRLLVLLSCIPLAVQLLTLLVPGYGYFIDEFYYLSCARRLAFGYVDHPPLAPAVLAVTRLVLGESLLAIRLVPFLAGSATVFVTGLVVRRLGGGRFALILACLGAGLMPALLASSGFFSMNVFEPLLWSLTLLVLVRLVQTGRSPLWLLVGLLVGLAFENKHTVLAFVAALGVGILATRARRMLLDRWLWAGAAVALAVALPNVAWQAASGWPSLEFYRSATLHKNVAMAPFPSLVALVFIANPLLAPVWLAGLGWLLVSREARALRFLGVAALIVIAAYVFSGTSRPDRPLATFPVLLAAGSVVFERWLRGRWSRAAAITLVAVAALALAPLAIPLVPPPALAQYVRALGLGFQMERGKTSPLPQLLADRTGWESFADDVARVCDDLPAGDRRDAVVYVPDYGHAGALELWGPARGLPPVIAPQNTWWHWSQGHASPRVLVAVDMSPATLHALFRDVREAGIVECAYCMSWRSHMPIYVARDPVVPLEAAWPRFRHYE